jgi:hypothetical protein
MGKKKIKKESVLERAVFLPIIIFSGWLFFWPLVECWYAQSLSILIGNPFKLWSFVIGGIIFWTADYYFLVKEKRLLY